MKRIAIFLFAALATLVACKSSNNNAIDEPTPPSPPQAEVRPSQFASDAALLDYIEKVHFNYMWDGAEPTSGLARERIHLDNNYPQNDRDVVTTGGSGFGIAGLLAACERGFITRQACLQRLTTIVDYLARADRFHGVWPHWLDGPSGKVKPFGQKDNGGDLVESCFLMQGLLCARQYFNGTSDAERDIAEIDADGNVTGLSRSRPERGEVDVCTNLMVMRREDLQAELADALAHGYTSFHRDVIGRNLGRHPIHAFRFNDWYTQIDSLETYFSASMELLAADARNGLFGDPDRKIYTKIRNSAPTRYVGNAKVSNSLIADGCVIEGTVENSILFRGVRIGRGTVVRNSILLQDTLVGNDVSLNCVITDKNVVIHDGRTLSGHETMPFFIGKGMTV